MDEREPRERGPDEADEAQAGRVLLRLVPVALALFLGSIALGLVPRLLADRSPALARLAAVGVWLVLPLLAVAMVANVLRRFARQRRRERSGEGGPPDGPGCDRDPPP